MKYSKQMKGGDQGERKTEEYNDIIRDSRSCLYGVFDFLCE